MGVVWALVIIVAVLWTVLNVCELLTFIAGLFSDQAGIPVCDLDGFPKRILGYFTMNAGRLLGFVYEMLNEAEVGISDDRFGSVWQKVGNFFLTDILEYPSFILKLLSTGDEVDNEPSYI